MDEDILPRLDAAVRGYLERVAGRGEYLSLLRWQIAAGHRLDRRTTLPGHLTTSALIVSPRLKAMPPTATAPAMATSSQIKYFGMDFIGGTGRRFLRSSIPQPAG